MVQELRPLSLGYAAAIVSAIGMLILAIFGNLGIYTDAVEMMQQWHMFFSLTPAGIIAGMIEAAIISFVILYLFAVFYNRLA
ncbi:conserved hypothetical protein [Methanosalsum zhilinae DSM 4017]|uniref:Uncharacterized protein n=1 Tax=Methanosalsum zhilinae (strain DSM 4017 / NBRC 107636 / OCM 62 / WeN5) TaxID=679901 RepID=F7XM54_METZD|nr:hypothetical protein [Methanosalsum zhilinae]AEH61460.1 conserved hypothetical protein [Methanosalsum zhilinae DSM 4017]